MMNVRWEDQVESR